MILIVVFRLLKCLQVEFYTNIYRMIFLIFARFSKYVKNELAGNKVPTAMSELLNFFWAPCIRTCLYLVNFSMFYHKRLLALLYQSLKLTTSFSLNDFEIFTNSDLMQLNIKLSGSCLDLCFERIISLLLLYSQDMHNFLLCWSIDTKIVKFREN